MIDQRAINEFERKKKRLRLAMNIFYDPRSLPCLFLTAFFSYVYVCLCWWLFLYF
jgi:hypothetical protein